MVHPRAGDVRRQQVGGKLHPAEGAGKRPGQGLGQGGFAGAGHILQQDVSPGHQRCQRQLDFLLLAHNNPGDALRNTPCEGGDGCVFHMDPSFPRSFAVMLCLHYSRTGDGAQCGNGRDLLSAG